MNNINTRLPMQIFIEKFLRSPDSHSLNLNSHERILMVMLASYMGEKKYCWPSYKSLMLDCGMAKATLSKSIKSLEKKQVISIEKQYGINNKYTFVFNSTSSRCELKNDSQVQGVNSTGSTCELVPVQHIDSNNIINNINNNISDFFILEEQKKLKAEAAKAEIRRICRIKTKKN